MSHIVRELRRFLKGAIVFGLFILVVFFVYQLVMALGEWIGVPQNQVSILRVLALAAFLSISWGVGTAIEENWGLKEDGNDPRTFPDEK